jgi:hypothetical protein
MKGVDILLSNNTHNSEQKAETKCDIRICSTEQSRLHQVGDHIGLTIDDNLYSVDNIGTKTRDT